MFPLIALAIVCGLIPASSAHDRPIIGILTQEISRTLDAMYPKQFNSFVPASYVKWIESGGARVVPIWLGQNREYYVGILSKLNGVLLPGGSVNRNEKGGYAEAARYILEIAAEFNFNRDFFPVFGVGLGMDFMLYQTNNFVDISTECRLDFLSASLVLSQKDTKKTALYNSTTDHLRKLMTTHPIAVLGSKRCFTQENFEASRLANIWIPFSFNYDLDGQVIVSSVEHQVLPFYGTLFHSEKVPFEWVEQLNIPHTLATVEVSQFFANYFVNEARKSVHRFASSEEEFEHVIENYPSFITASTGQSTIFQSFLFNTIQKL